jgi:arylsulfatase A-like enzyme
VEYIRRHKDGPFFLYLTHFGVHSPYEAKKELIEKFKAKAAAGGHHDPTYAAMIASVDESVGRVMAVLDELKLAEDTVLIFTSDNGGVGGYIREGIGGRVETTDNAPLRSGKGSLYEGGTRVPFIVRWPGTTKAGATCEVPAIHVDMYPTFVDIAAGKRPEGYALDGESLVPLFKDAQAKLKREAIYAHFPGYLGAKKVISWRTTPVGVIVAGDWKLMEFFEDNRVELYNLREDVGEARNLAAKQPERVKELRGKLVAWRAEVQAPMPTANTPGAFAEVLKKSKGKKGGDD